VLALQAYPPRPAGFFYARVHGNEWKDDVMMTTDL